MYLAVKCQKNNQPKITQPFNFLLCNLISAHPKLPHAESPLSLSKKRWCMDPVDTGRMSSLA